MIHVAILIPTLDRIGGAESQVLLLAEGLALRGWRVTLIALSGESTAVSENMSEGMSDCKRQRLIAAGVCMISLGMRKAWIDPSGWMRYLRWKREFRPDIAHAHLSHAVFFTRWVRLFSPIRLVVETIHTTRAASPRDRIVTRLSNWLSDRTTCVSAAVAESVLRASTVPAQKLSVLANGVEFGLRKRNCSAANLDQSSDEATFRWLAIGRLAPVKDYPTMLLAFASIVKRAWSKGRTAPRLTIVGSGPEESALQELASRLGIAKQMELAGFQWDVQPYLADADAFVLSSRWEGLPIGVLEAQAASLPVVATDGPGTAQAMIDGKTGFLVPVGSADLLSEAMAKVMEMPCCEREQMGETGRHFVAYHFSVDATLDQWENLYHDLLATHPVPTRWARARLTRRVAGVFLKAVSASGFVHSAAGIEGSIRKQAIRKEHDPGK